MRTRRHAVAYAQENRETGGPPGGHAAVTATRPAGGSPFPDSPRGFDFGFAHAASTPPDGPRSSSCAAGTRRSTRNTKTLRRLRPDFSACPTNANPMSPGAGNAFRLHAEQTQPTQLPWYGTSQISLSLWHTILWNEPLPFEARTIHSYEPLLDRISVSYGD